MAVSLYLKTADAIVMPWMLVFLHFLHLFFAPLLCESDFPREPFPFAILELRVVGVRALLAKGQHSLGNSSLCKENGT